MRHRWGRPSWLLPVVPDVIGLLVEQGKVTIEGAEAFDRWAQGDAAAAKRVRQIEHTADDARRAVITVVRRAFALPIEPEDLFELSERLDNVMNQMKDLVREAEVLSVEPDQAIAEMAGCTVAGVRELASAFPALAADPDAATEAADRAIHQHRGIERVYRRAMSALLEEADVRSVGAKRELYRRCARIGDAIEHVANRIWYAVVKVG